MLERRLAAFVVAIGLAHAAWAHAAWAQSPGDDAARVAHLKLFSFERPEFAPPATSPAAQRPTPRASTRPPPIRISERSGDDLRPINIGGWTEVSYTASSDRRTNGPMGFNNRANQFLLQQNWLQIDRRAVSEDAVAPTLGFRLDCMLPGSDYRFTLPRGLFNQQLTAHHGQPNLYGIDPVQFYAEGYLPNVAEGMSVKIGRFYAPWGVEAVNAPGNALLSHTYTFVYDPFTQTGLLTNTKLNRNWSMQAGIVIGNDMFIAPGNEPKFTGNLAWAPPDGEHSLRFSTIIGSGRYNQRLALDNLNLFELIYTRRLDERWKYTLACTYGYQSNVPGSGLANWLGVQQYFTRQYTERVSSTLRLELFDDAQGQRTGFRGLYTVLTGGLGLKLSKSLLVRPELRFDYNGRSRPFEGHHGLFLAATDLIWSW